MNTHSKLISIPAILLFFIGFLLYAETISFGYNGDDDIFIADNTITMAGLDRVSEIFSGDGVMDGWLEKEKTSIEEEGFRKRYRPMAQFSFAIEVAVSGKNPLLSHFINVLLFSITVVLIFFVIKKLQPDGKPWYKSFAFWTALIFAIHPVHTEVVANIKSRDEILALFFFLLAIGISLTEKVSLQKKILVFVFYLLSLLSKENAITFLAIVPLMVYFESSGKFNLKKHWHTIAPYLLAAIVFGILSMWALKNNNEAWNKDIFSDYFYQLSLSEKYGTIFVSLGKYLQLLVLPFTLLCDYSVYQIPVMGMNKLLPWLVILLHMGILIFAIRTLKNRNICALAIFFYFISMSVYSNLIFSTGTAVAERFMYIPSLAFCMGLAWLMTEQLPILFKRKPYLFSILLLTPLLLFYSVKTVVRNHEWKDGFSLIHADVHKTGKCARLNNAYAEYFFDGKKEQAGNEDSLLIARNYYLKAVSIYPSYLEALNTLATNYYYLGKYDSAAFYFYNSLLVKSGQLQVFKNITLALDSMKATPAAILYRRKLIELNPDLAPLYFSLGRDYKLAGKKDSAIYYLEKTIRKNPDFNLAKKELEALKK